MALDNENLRRYLLGASTGAESDELSVRIIEDEMFADQMSMAESDLIEAYLENDLSDNERVQFERNFLSSNERQERVEEIVLLKEYAARSGGIARVVSLEKKDPFWGRFSFGLRPAAAAFGIILIGLLTLAGWRLFLWDSSSQLERQYTVLNQADFDDLNRFREYSSIELVPGAYRDSSSGSKIRIVGSSESVLVRSSLPVMPTDGNNLTAELTREGKTVFTVRNLRPVRTGNVSEIRFLLPRTAFEKGEYQLNVTQPGTSNSPVVYSFAIE